MSGYDKIVAREFGAPQVLEIEHIDALPEPGPGEARVRVEAAGVGYTDTILRRGRYVAYTGGLPATPGYDVVGIVDKLGEGVTGLTVGQRVADMPVSGAYSQYIVRPATMLIPVPDGVDAAIAVEMPLMWMTAWQMLTRNVSLSPGAAILVVGAAGAVGRALVALGQHLNLKIIGTCSAANIAAVEAMGATAIDYNRPDLAAAIIAASDGKGVAAAFDAIGGKSWDASWAALGANGHLIGYGLQDFIESDAPGSEAGLALKNFFGLNETGKQDGTGRGASFYDINVRRGTDPEDYRQDAAALLDLMADGTVRPPAPEILPLSAAADAHRRIASGGLHRRIVLQP